MGEKWGVCVVAYRKFLTVEKKIVKGLLIGKCSFKNAKFVPAFWGDFTGKVKC